MTGKREDGAVTVFIAVTMVLLLGIGALAVDLGMQRVVRRDMQALADVVALDLARTLDQRTVAELQDEIDPAVSSGALAQSLLRNDDFLGEALSVTATLGFLDVAGAFVPLAQPADVPSAVKVVASAEVDFSFTEGSGAASRSAVASTVKSGCFSVGSYAARFRSGDSSLISTLLGPMNDILEPQANIDALSYQGLATTTVSVNELVAAGAAGTVDGLLTGSISGRRLIESSITALQRQSTDNSVAIAALDQVLKGQADLTTPVLLAQVLKVSPSDAAALDVGFNVLDLVAGTLLVASGGHAIDLGNGNLSAGTGNLSPVGQATVTIVESPRQACGQFGSPEATASTSQLDAVVPMTLQLPSINGITGATGVVQTPEAAVNIVVDLGNSVATLAADPVCAGGTAADPDKMYVDVASGLAQLQINTTLKFQATLRLGVTNYRVTFDQEAVARLDMPDVQTRAELLVPPNDSTPLSVGSPVALGDFTIATTATNMEAYLGQVKISDGLILDALFGLLGNVSAQLAVNASVTGPLNSLAASLNDTLTPLRRLLGLNVSGADLLALSRPICAAPVLRG